MRRMRRLLLAVLWCSVAMIGQSKISDNQLRTPPPLQCNDTTTSGTTQTCTTAPSFTPAAKDCVVYNTTTTNTGALTLNVNSSSAAPVKKWLGTALVAGDVVANKPQLACYDGTNWLLSTIGNAPGTGSGNVTAAGTLTSHGVVLGAGTTAVSVTAAGTTGQLLTGVTGADPTWQAATSSGPVFQAVLCSANALTCATTANTVGLIAGTDVFVLCGYNTTSGGIGTPSISDTATLTWTNISTASFVNYSGSNSLAELAYWATTGASSGADTFTCATTGTGAASAGITVFSVIGASTTSPIDGTPTTKGANSVTALNITTTTANDLLIVASEFSGSGLNLFPPSTSGINATSLTGSPWSTIAWFSNTQDFFRQASMIGTYYFQQQNGNNAIMMFAVH